MVFSGKLPENLTISATNFVKNYAKFMLLSMQKMFYHFIIHVDMSSTLYNS